MININNGWNQLFFDQVPDCNDFNGLSKCTTNRTCIFSFVQTNSFRTATITVRLTTTTVILCRPAITT
ncbi:hypothetical protein ACT9XH_01720 [Methanococcoides methylutens]|uniref:hypothetical protein n=1 Tax=Methanococcoides methylutens TaxID=2226 RepID=UPI004044F945